MQLLRLASAVAAVALLWVPAALAEGGPETTLSVFDRSYGTASVGATASPADATVRCAVDGVEQPSCGRIDVVGLAPGTHTFTATAVDASGVADPTPLVHSWVASESPDPGQPSPPNDNLHAAQQLAGASGVVDGTTLNASRQWDEPFSTAPTGGEKSVWYQWLAGRTGDVTFTVSSDEFVPFVGQGHTWIEPTGVGEVTFRVLQGATYRIVVDTNDGRSGAFRLSWAFADDEPANDYLADAETIEGVSGSVRGTTAGSTLEPNEPDHGARDTDGSTGNSVWYRWTAPATGDVFFNTEGSAVDTDLSVYTDGTDVSQLSVRLTAGDLNPWTTWSRGWFRAVAGGTYAIAVAGHDGEAGDIVLNWRMTIPGGDGTWATLTPLAPTPGEHIAGTYTFAADASDDVAVDRVEWTFGPNGGPTWFLGEDTTAPYSVALDTTRFPEGLYSVGVIAYDTSGNPSTGVGATVYVDNYPDPQLTVPGDLTVEATTPVGAVVSYVASATAADGTALAVTCSPRSGTLFRIFPGPPRPTTVRCSTTDSWGQTVTKTFRVTVVDTTPPTLQLPDGLTVDATGPTGATVGYQATATDATSPNLALGCTPASGSEFALGDTTVTCGVTDRFGNTSHGTFTVHVKGAQEQLADLGATLVGMQLGSGAQRFEGKRSEAASGLAAGEIAVTCESLRSFLEHVDKEEGRLLTAEQAATLRVAATRIRAVIGC